MMTMTCWILWMPWAAGVPPSGAAAMVPPAVARRTTATTSAFLFRQVCPMSAPVPAATPRGSRFADAQARVLVAGEDAVEGAAGVDHDVLGLGDLGIVAGLGDLDDGDGHLADERAQLQRQLVDAAGGGLPGRGLAGHRLGRAPPLLGEAEDALAVALLGADQPLVLELLQGGVDRAGAGSPDAAAAVG